VRPRLLDLFCGAGGCSTGYHRAGFDVTGVDISPQPRYPFEFVQADAMTYPLDGYDAIHASPPCQDHVLHPAGPLQKPHGTGWMLAATRERLQVTGRPWVIENVPGAPLRVDLRLCGCMFGLPHLKRERWFETSWGAFDLRQPCQHHDGTMSVTGTGPGSRIEKRVFGRWPSRLDWQRAMGIDWMSTLELAQAIPPAYTEYVGQMLVEHLAAERAA
jgi:DNA (cytosine-5)-methyltransferase 1